MNEFENKATSMKAIKGRGFAIVQADQNIAYGLQARMEAPKDSLNNNILLQINHLFVISLFMYGFLLLFQSPQTPPAWCPQS